MIADHRDDTTRKPVAWAVATDRFMSGWGQAPRRSLFAVPIYSHEHQDAVLGNLEDRSDMRRVRLVYTLRSNGLPRIRMYHGDHLSLSDSDHWYVPGFVARQNAERRARETSHA